MLYISISKQSSKESDFIDNEPNMPTRKTEAVFPEIALEKPNAVVLLFSGVIKVQQKTPFLENKKTEHQESCFCRIGLTEQTAEIDFW